MRKDTREKRGRRDWKPYPNRAPVHSRRRFRATGHYKAERVTGQSHGPSQTGAALCTLGDGGDIITGAQLKKKKKKAEEGLKLTPFSIDRSTRCKNQQFHYSLDLN